MLELARIEKIIARGDRFAQRVLTPAEYQQYQQYHKRRKAEYLGGRFSLKESFAKAMGTGIGRFVGLQDVETLDDALGKPVMTSSRYHGHIWVSLSHSEDYVVTQVILEDEN